MDTSENGNSANLSIAVEQNNETTKEMIEEVVTTIESAKTTCEEFAHGEFEKKENSLVHKNKESLNEIAEQVHEDSEDIAEKETAKTVQKEVIKILNVELVVPGKENLVKFDESNNEVNEMDVNSQNSPDIDMAANSDSQQVQNETCLEETKMATTEVCIDSTPGESQHVSSCSENIENNTESTERTGLSLLSQYQSDDDADSVVEVPLAAAQDYRNQVVEIDSSSDSDDSSSSSDVEYLNELRKTIEKRIEVADEDEGEEGDGTGKRRRQQKLRVKGEMFLEDLPPIQDLQITVPENDCIEFGKIHSIVDQLVLVSTLPNSILLNLDTVIFLEKGQKVLGEVFDVLGQVADPLYCVRFNSNKQIKEKQLKVGDIVYVAPKTQYTQYVILSNLMTAKGSDASWEHDMEPPPKFLDYSDDEQEQLARRQLRNKDRPNDNEDASKRPRSGDNDGEVPTCSSHNPNLQNRKCYEQKSNRGGPAGHSNTRPRYNGPQQNQQQALNHYSSSWHSNYNPHNFPTQPPSNFIMQLPQTQPQPHQAYHPNMTAYAMPTAQNMPYPPVPAPPPPYGVPHMFHQYPQQLMPPTLHGPLPPAPHNHQYTSNYLPPGSQ